MRRPLFWLTVVGFAGCVDARETPEDVSGWYNQGEAVSIEEAISFTTTEYALPENSNDGIGDYASRVFPVGEWDSANPQDLWAIKYGPGEGFTGDCGVLEDDALPFEVEGIVTLHPSWYIKSYGCATEPDNTYTPDSEEKYYSSYFIQDRTGGLFVLFDSRVAPFTVGDRVRLRVRAVRSNHWDDGGEYLGSQDMIYAHDIVSVERESSPIYYVEVDEPLDIRHVNRVVRASGTVVDIDESFNNVTVETESGAQVVYSLGLDLGRRPSAHAEVGDHVVATGPVLLSYDTFTISVAQVGQLTIDRPE